MDGQDASFQCSTPFGVTDSITLSYRCLCADEDEGSAQRLSASLIRSRRRGFAVLPTAIVCSTPFGVTDSITFRHVQTAPSKKCAQRLSASLIRSPRRLDGTSHWRLGVLNAFRRH